MVGAVQLSVESGVLVNPWALEVSKPSISICHPSPIGGARAHDQKTRPVSTGTWAGKSRGLYISSLPQHLDGPSRSITVLLSYTVSNQFHQPNQSPSSTCLPGTSPTNPVPSLDTGVKRGSAACGLACSTVLDTLPTDTRWLTNENSNCASCNCAGDCSSCGCGSCSVRFTFYFSCYVMDMELIDGIALSIEHPEPRLRQ
jgi:hypothetical protein